MGRSPKPLTILVHHEFLEWDEIKRLQEQGHSITAWGESGYDLVLSPEAWRMTPDLRPYLDLAIKAARKKKYGKEESNERSGPST